MLDSIAERRDAKAIALLDALDFLENVRGDRNPAAAALAGLLPYVGTEKAHDALGWLAGAADPHSATQAAAIDGLLVFAERSAAGEAVRLPDEAGDYAIVAGVAPDFTWDCPRHLKVAGFHGLFRQPGQFDTRNLLLTLIRSADPELFNVGLAVARTLPGEYVGADLWQHAGGLPPQRQALLLRA